MSLLSPKKQCANMKIEYDYVCPSPGSLTSLSSADYTAGGMLDPHVSRKVQRSSTFTASNQHFTDETNNKKLAKMKQFFDNYQDTISALEIEVADKQRELEKLDKLLKMKGEAEESLKEQIWNLELKNQDLQQQINQLQFSSAKTLTEQTRLERENEILGQDLENLKFMQQTNESEMKKIQQDHDHELFLLKKALTHLKQEKATLIKQIENNGVKSVSGGGGGGNIFQSNNINQVNPKDQFIKHHPKAGGEDSPNTLKATLENAHTMIRELEKQIQDEAQERREVDQLLREAQETIESYRSSSVIPSQWGHHQQQQQRREGFGSSRANSPLGIVYQGQLGQSLGDELYQFFNSTTFEKLKGTAEAKDSLSRESSHDTLDEPLTLTLDALPPLSNVESIKQQEEFGSLIKEPESYIYRPIEKIPKNNTTNTDTIKLENHHNLVETPYIKRDYQQVKSTSTNCQNIDKSHLTAIAITMAGTWMWKHKRKVIGNSISSHKHRRFVWIHPYSRTLYWSVIEPGSKGTEYKTKSASIESFVVLDQDKNLVPSILIKTSIRGIQVQCLDMDMHHFWSRSLRCLLMDDGVNIDKATSLWLDDIIKPALGKRGLDTRVRNLLESEDQPKNNSFC